jgi:hypothetical protein
MRRTLPLAIVAVGPVLLGARPAMATSDGEPLHWDPGNPTTSPLRGEVQGASAGATGDGVYGRFDAPVTLGLHAGVEASGPGAAAAGRVAAHYYFTAGIYAAYAEGLSRGAKGSRWVSFGVDLQPAFLPRWSQAMEAGPSHVDLLLDSISLGIGAYFLAPEGGSLGDERGFELSLGAGVPVFSSVEGPWLGARGMLRFADPSRGDRRPDGEAAALVTLGYKWMAGGS